MLIGDNNHQRIIVASIDGSSMDTIISSSEEQSFYDADVDPVNKKFYLAWYWGIYSMNYDGTEFKTLVSYPSGGYSCGIAVDPGHGHIYWGSTQEGKIFRADLDGGNKVTFLSGLGYIGDVDIDLENGYLFYGQYIIGTTKGLYRVNLNATNNVKIASDYDVQFLGLDTKNGIIYFSDGGTCRKINYAGTNDNLLFSFQPGGFFVDSENSLVYYSDMTNHRILVSDLFGANVRELINTELESPHGPVLFRKAMHIDQHPVNQVVAIGGTARFIVGVSEPNVSFQWQTDIGFGFQNLSNAGQYSGAQNDTLTISNIAQSNNNQHFRCIITSPYSTVTTEEALLIVTGNTGFENTCTTVFFKAFPNPAGNYLNVWIEKSLLGSSFEVFDMRGKKVIKGILGQEISLVDTEYLQNGIYLFVVNHIYKTSFMVLQQN